MTLWGDRDPGAVHVDEVVPPDPQDSRPRLDLPVLALRVPDKEAFERRIKYLRPFTSVAEHIVEALYGDVEPDGRGRPVSGWRHLTQNHAWKLYEHNPHLPPDAKTGVRFLPVGQRPLFEVDFEFPFRAVDWAAVHPKTIDDKVTDPTDRVLAVAAHQGLVVEGFEDRILPGMQELVKSAQLLAGLVGNRLPAPPKTGKSRSLKRFAEKGKKALHHPGPEALESPHFWWAARFVRDTYWAYAPINVPVSAPALQFGEYDARLETGLPCQKRYTPPAEPEQVLAYLEATARADMGVGPRPHNIGHQELRLARWGLVTFRLPYDRALKRRVGYCPYITPRGWRTLWAHGRMTEWLDALMPSPSG